MADYVTTHIVPTNTGNLAALYRIYEAVKNSGMFTLIEDPGWTSEDDPVAGSYFVIESNAAFAAGEKWQAIFCRGGAAVGGYDDPGAYLFVKASFLGGWDTSTHTFGTGSAESDWKKIEQAGAIGSYGTEWYITCYSYSNPDDSSATLDGIALIGDMNSAGTWILGGIVGKFRGLEPESSQKYPMVVGGMRWDTYSTTHMAFYWAGTYIQIPNSTTWADWVDGYMGPIADMQYNHGTTDVSGNPVEWPVSVQNKATSTQSGLLPLIMQGDRALAIGTPSYDGTRKLFNGVGWPI
jgi:hypothetical protein